MEIKYNNILLNNFKKGDFNLKKGDRVEILSFNHNLGN
jgi:hypothetical protein